MRVRCKRDHSITYQLVDEGRDWYIVLYDGGSIPSVVRKGAFELVPDEQWEVVPDAELSECLHLKDGYRLQRMTARSSSTGDARTVYYVERKVSC